MAVRLYSGILIYFHFINMKNKNSSVFFAKIHPLEKLINNILTGKVFVSTKKLLYLKQKNSNVFLKGFTQLENFIKFNLCRSVILNTKKISCWGIFRGRDSLTGFTLIEALIVIAIIGIMSVFYVINLRPDTTKLLEMDTTRLAADIRYVRSLATSRVTYNGTFPIGGYGIIFKNETGTNKSWYKLYADSTNNIIKTVYLSDAAFSLVDPNSALPRELAINDTTQKRLAFIGENKLTTSGFGASADGDYQIEIYYDIDSLHYSKATINIGRQTVDNFVWSNLAVTYDTKGIECGNGIVETGESCERLAEDGTTVIDAGCFSAGLLVDPDNIPNNGDEINMGCKRNSCGDGVIAGTENCELNANADVKYYTNHCSNLPHHNWCYNCDHPANVNNVCQDIAGNSINCCLSNKIGTCTDCQWINDPCFNEPRICPIDTGI